MYTPNKKIFAKCNVTISQPALAPYTVNYLVMRAIADESDQKAVEENLNQYLAEKASDKLPNTKLHFTFIDGDMGSQISLMAAAGEKFDLTMNPYGLSMPSAVAKGIFLPIDDLLKKYGQTIMKVVDPKMWAASTIKGKIYAIPHPFVYATTNSMVFKKELVEKYKFDYMSVKTPKDLEPFLKDVKKGEPGMTPFFPDWSSLLNTQVADKVIEGVSYYLKDNKLIWDFDIPENLENAKTLYDFYNKGYIPKDLISIIENIAQSKSGKYAVVPDAGIYDATGEKSTNLYGFPTVEAPLFTPIIGTTGVLTMYTAVSATSEDPERAMMMQDYMYEDKTFFNLTCYGKEGLNFEYTAGKGTDNPSVKTKDGSKWTIWECWTGPLWYQWDSNWNSTKALQAMKKATESAPVSPILGFLPDLEPIKKEAAQVSAIYDETRKVLVNGIEPNLETYLAEQKVKAQKAGLDKMIVELNAQLTKWRTQNGK